MIYITEQRLRKLMEEVSIKWHKVGYDDGMARESFGTIKAQMPFDLENQFLSIVLEIKNDGNQGENPERSVATDDQSE